MLPAANAVANGNPTGYRGLSDVRHARRGMVACPISGVSVNCATMFIVRGLRAMEPTNQGDGCTDQKRPRLGLLPEDLSYPGEKSISNLL